MADRTEEPRLTLGALIYVVFLALVAVATVVSFGIASFSLLYSAKEMPEGSAIRDRGAELKPALSRVIPYTPGNAVPVPAEKLPTPASEGTLRASGIGTTPTVPIPAEQREQIFREFERYNSQMGKGRG
jgi:hypothetical protein